METWIKSITSYMVFSVFFLQILPSTKYEKYIRVFVGMLFLLVIIQPIMELFSVNQSFWGHFEENMLMVQAKPSEVETMEALIYDNVLTSYETQLEKDFMVFAQKEQQKEIERVQVMCQKNRDASTWGQLIQVVWYRSDRDILLEEPVIIQPGIPVEDTYIPVKYQEFIQKWKETFQISDTVLITFE